MYNWHSSFYLFFLTVRTIFQGNLSKLFPICILLNPWCFVFIPQRYKKPQKDSHTDSRRRLHTSSVITPPLPSFRSIDLLPASFFCRSIFPFLLLFLLIGEYFIAPPTHPLQFRQLSERYILNVSLQLLQLFFHTSHLVPSVLICFQIFFLFIFLKYLKIKKEQKYKNPQLQC